MEKHSIKKGCFVNCISMPEDMIPASGVMKKVYSQIKTLRTAFEVDHVLINTFGKKETPISKIKRRLPFFAVDHTWKYSPDFAGYDFLYFRKSDVDHTVYTFFRDLKRANPACKVIFEIPTYPYEKENFHGKKDWPMLMKDCCTRKKLHRCVDRILTYSEDKQIFGISTIRTMNGLDFSAVQMKSSVRKYSPDQVNIIGVASFSPAHGYDRVLEGLGRYYENGGERNVIVHLVGGGSCLAQYKEIVSRYGLEAHVVFYGWKSGKELDEIYDHADVALDMLSPHYRDCQCSTLKSRECGAKGLPIINSYKVDYLPEDYPYQWIIPDDDSPVDIRALVAFVDTVYRDKPEAEVSKEIRAFAETHCDMRVTMRPVIDYILNATVPDNAE